MDPDKDEDIEIDFTKIKNKVKNFIQSDKKEEKNLDATSIKPEKDDDEIKIDFSKIKNFFKSDEKEAKDDGDLAVNWSNVSNFFKRYGIIFLVLIPIILSIYVRMQSGLLLFTDDWARNAVINNLRSQIRSGIDQQYPNLPDSNKNTLVNNELQKITTLKRAEIDQQIKGASNYFKSFFQDENGKNYMPDIDPYYWFRYVKNIVEHGHPGDVLKDGKPYDNHQVAPVGRFVQADVFHVYFLAYFYKVLHFFAPDLSLMRSMFYYPVFVSALSVLIVFFIARRIAGNTGGFFAAMMMAVNAAFLGRTLFGHADSDAWVVFFPLLITWLFVLSIYTKNILKILIITIIAGFFTGLYSLAWTGWWHVFDFLLITIALEFLYLFYISFVTKGRNLKSIFSEFNIRSIFIVGIVYFVSTAIFVTLFLGWSTFLTSFLGPLSFPSIKAPVGSGASLWPNVLTTVAELNEGSINGIINSIGGPSLFFISLLGLILSVSRDDGIKKFDFIYIFGTALFYLILFIKLGSRPPLYQSLQIITLAIWITLPIIVRLGISAYKKDSSYNFQTSILLCIWIISTIYASIKGIRFTLLLAPAFSVAFGVALGQSYIYISRWLSRELKIHKAIGSSILIVLLLLIYVTPISSALGEASSDVPIVNDAWYNALIAIKQDSHEDAIITSWWDFGHHFKAIADRRVTFDGTTQTHPAAHWVGRMLMTSDETEAIGILRMLDCGSNNAYNELYKITNDTHFSLKILRTIILMDKSNAEKKLKEYNFSQKEIEQILSFTHCQPPDAYFIASEDMIGKSGVWSHFGSWNFEKADLWKNARKLSQEQAVEYITKKFNYTKDKAESIYSEMQSITSDSEANAWISPWPGYPNDRQQRELGCNKDSKGIYACNNGLQINLSNYDVYGVGQQGIVRPKMVAFTTEDGILKKEVNSTTNDFGTTIIPISQNELLAIMSSKELTAGMFTRMFYMQGHGLKYFKLFNHQRGLTGTDIYTYKIDWEGKNTTIVKDYADFFKKSSINNMNLSNTSNSS